MSTPLSQAARGTPERRVEAQRDLVLYLATLFLGASIFLMPIEGAHIGMLPLVLLLVAILPPCVWLYGRMATLSVRRDATASGGGDALGRSLVAAGAGPAGTLLSLIGISVYVIAAAITYNRLGVAGLEVLAAETKASGTVAVGMLALFATCVVLVRVVPETAAVAQRLLRVNVVWGVGVLAVALIGNDETLTSATALLVFAIGCLVVSRAPSAGDVTERDADALTPDHRASVVALWVQFAGMGLLVLIAIAFVATSATASFSWDVLWTADGVSPADVIGPSRWSYSPTSELARATSPSTRPWRTAPTAARPFAAL